VAGEVRHHDRFEVGEIVVLNLVLFSAGQYDIGWLIVSQLGFNQKSVKTKELKHLSGESTEIF